MSDVKQPKIGQVWGTPSLPLSWLLVEEVKSDGIVVARWGETTRKWMALEWWQSFTGQRSVRLIHDPQERTMFHGEPQEGDIWGDPRDVYSWVLVQEIDYDRECIEVMKWGIHGTQAWTAGKWRAFTTYTGIKRVERSKEDAKPLDVEASIINLAERLDALAEKVRILDADKCELVRRSVVVSKRLQECESKLDKLNPMESLPPTPEQVQDIVKGLLKDLGPLKLVRLDFNPSSKRDGTDHVAADSASAASPAASEAKR